MASARAMIERRRSSRVMARIPVGVSLWDAPGQSLDAIYEATSVSRSGALLRIPFSPVLGSRIEVQHGLSQESREFRVVRVSTPHPDGLFELGVEILHPNENFWGIAFPDDSDDSDDSHHD
ncbi:MAG: hypothetical protein ABSA57_09470 [Candidatus Acidiferrales bacterium]|jgi:hypothetical protein